MRVATKKQEQPLAHIAQSLDEGGWPVYRDNSFLLATEHARGDAHYLVYFGFLNSVSSVRVTTVFDDLQVSDEHIVNVGRLVSLINNYLWLGSLSLDADSGVISYRHTIVDSYHSFKTAAKMDAYMSHVLNECERVRPAFALLLQSGCSVELAFESMMLETHGHC